MNSKKKIYFIVYLRAIAVLLITNSHFDGVYPWNISFGGAPGVAVFFLITGFLLSDIDTNQSILAWYCRKLVRLYPAIWISTLILLGCRELTISSAWDVLNLFLYPTHWWYIKNLLLMYVLFYLEVKVKMFSDKHWIVMWIIIYALCFITNGVWNSFFVDSYSFRLCYGMVAMHSGCVLRKLWDRNEVALGERDKALKWALLCVLSMFLFLAIKVMIDRIEIAYRLQFLVHISSVSFAYCCCRFLMHLENRLLQLDGKAIARLLTIVSKCSLEIYLIQRSIIDALKAIVFPINLILISVAVLVAGSFIHFAAEFTRRAIIRRRDGEFVG